MQQDRDTIAGQLSVEFDTLEPVMGSGAQPGERVLGGQGTPPRCPIPAGRARAQVERDCSSIAVLHSVCVDHIREVGVCPL